jgi:predicted metalloprotease with PDZ domain
LICELAGDEMNAIFDDYFYGTRPFEAILTDAFETIGLELHHQPSKRYSYARLGFKTLPVGNHHIAKAIYPGSPADLGGLMLEDEIIAVNGFALNGELDKWLEYVDDREKHLTVIRAGKLLELSLPEVQRNFYLEYSVLPVENPNGAQKKAFEHWSR